MSQPLRPGPAAVASAAAVVILALGLTGTAQAATPTTSAGHAVRAADDPDQPDNPLYDAPESFDVTSGREAVSLSWSPLSAATAYEVSRAEAEGTGPDEVGPYESLGTVSAAEYVDDAADPDVTYSYRVRALDGAGHVSPWTEPRRGVRDTVAPFAPRDLTRVREDERGVTLTWRTGDSDSVKYVVYRAESPNSTWVKAGSTASLTFRDTKGIPGRTYVYEVRGVDAVGNESPPSNWETGTRTAVPATVPTAPVVADSHIVGKRLTLRWSQNQDVPVSSYTVYRSRTSPVDTGAAANRVATVTRTEYSTTVGEDERDYFYAVVATSKDAVPSPASASVRPEYTAPRPPGATQVYDIAPGENSVRLDWYVVPYGSDESRITGYRVYRSTTPGVTKENAEFRQSTADSQYVDRELTVGTTYYYAVATVNEDGLESALSPEVSATPTA